MNSKKLKRNLENETEVCLSEWKDLITLLYLTHEKPIKPILRNKYNLSDIYVDYLCEEVQQDLS